MASKPPELSEQPEFAPDEEIDKLFAIANESTEPVLAQPDSMGERLKARAAVVGSFLPAELSEGLGDSKEVRAALDSVLAASVPVVDGATRRWMLQPEPRQQVLQALGAGAADVLESVKRAASDGISQALEYRIPVPPAGSLDTESLRSLVTAAKWFGESDMTAGRLPEWKAELKRRQLLEPLGRVIGKGFVGREKEMKILRDFVDVVPPESQFGGWTRWISNLGNQVRRPAPFVIHGIGGIGKSALMAQFILTHAAVAGEREFPFVYLDFDRYSLDPHNPATLLNEMLVQLGAQFPRVESRGESLRDNIREELDRARRNQRASSGASNRVPEISDYSFLARITSSFVSYIEEAGLADRPFLLVLDTFEEVQLRGEAAVEAVFKWLDDLAELSPLRTVISGRAPVEDHRTFKQFQLGNFDQKAAMAFLANEGVASARAKAIYDKVGGNPLSLRLMMQIASEGNLASVDKSEIQGLFGRYDDLVVQGYLYTRLLKHIKDKRVEKLAHPGLVLRRITPDIILKVLGPAAGLKVDTVEDAQDLYAALRREVSLVSEAGGALIHRKDVRSVMLELQRKDKERPADFMRLNELAVEYYRALPDPSQEERLELLYHRLLLAKDNPFDVLSEAMPTQQMALASALDELPETASIALRFLLGRALTKREANELPDDAWVAYAYRRTVSLIAAGLPDQAIAVAEARDTHWNEAILSLPLGLVYFQTIEWVAAEAALGQVRAGQFRENRYFAPDRALQDEVQVRPLVERGYVQWYLGKHKEAISSFSQAVDQADRGIANLVLWIEARLGGIVVGDPNYSISVERPPPDVKAFQSSVRDVGIDGWRSSLATLRRVVFLGFASREVLPAAVRLLGLRLQSADGTAEFLRRFGSLLSSALAGDLEHRLSVASESDRSPAARARRKSEGARLERSVAAELGRLEALPFETVPFIRGRFAAWKIPARYAMLEAMSDAKDIQALVSRNMPAIWADAGVAKARNAQDLADAVIDCADENGDLDQIMGAFLQLAKAKGSKAQMFQFGIEQYATQTSRYGAARRKAS